MVVACVCALCGQCFAGTDASRGLAKMDLKSTQYGVDDLTAAEKNTLKEWADKSGTEQQADITRARVQLQEAATCSGH